MPGRRFSCLPARGGSLRYGVLYTSLRTREVSPQATEGGTLPSYRAGKSERSANGSPCYKPSLGGRGVARSAGGMLPTAHLRARCEAPSRQRPFLLLSAVRTAALVFNRLPVKFLRASDLHSAAETSISGFSNRKLMFHAQFSGITGELYAAGQIRLMSAGEILLTGSILARAKGRLCGPLIPANRNGGCVPSFLLAEARRGRGAFLLPKSANAAL